MAVFLLKTKYGSGYVPPACTGVFDDVAAPAPPPSTSSSNSPPSRSPAAARFRRPLCPDGTSTRGQMAVFIVKRFNLQ